nr:MAG TPA: hypothetical protein [Caudoviricetes sp.]
MMPVADKYDLNIGSSFCFIYIYLQELTVLVLSWICVFYP